MENKSLTEQDIRAIIRDEVGRLFGNIFGFTNSQDIEWMTTKEAVIRLNYPSQDSLRKDIINGNLRIGEEVPGQKE